MKRVLMVGPIPPPFGGIASVISDIVHSKLKDDYQFDLFSRSETAEGGFFRRNLFRLRRLGAFLKTLVHRRYAFIHIHSADPNFVGSILFILAARLCRTKSLLHMHGTDWDDFYTNAGPKMRACIRWGVRQPDRIAVLYPLWAEKIRELAPGTDPVVIRNLTPDVQRPPESEIRAIRADLGVAPEDFLVLMVGSVGRRKGCFEIIKAASIIAHTSDRIKFVLVGGEENPGEWDDLQDQTQFYQTGRSILFTGETPRDKISAYLAAADVFLLPSFVEGMPISILEAMSAGLLVISTPVGAVPEMIEDEKTGLLISPGNPDEIASAVMRSALDGELRARLSSAARETFLGKYEFSRGIEEIRRIYESV
jgi:glycosyltransferase involved in cell wall biosynthesis